MVRMNAQTASDPLRVVVLTFGGYGLLVLDALRSRGVVPAAVVLESHAELRECFHKRTRLGRLAEVPLVPLRSLWRRIRPRLRRELRIGAPVLPTGLLNSAWMRRDLARLRPDILVLAGTGIVSPELLSIPRAATLNAHPALLPWVRGNSVVAHSILKGIALGATCHVVDPGIDTGPVLRRRLMDVTRVEPSLAALEIASLAEAAQLLADVVADAVRDGRLPSASPQEERFPLCRTMGAEARAEADRLMRAGRARALFERWSQLAPTGSGDLPVRVVAPATTAPPTAG
jgi:hypothetical protein